MTSNGHPSRILDISAGCTSARPADAKYRSQCGAYAFDILAASYHVAPPALCGLGRSTVDAPADGLLRAGRIARWQQQAKLIFSKSRRARQIVEKKPCT